MPNAHAVYVTLGASNHSANERDANDFYATDPKAVELLLQLETFQTDVWEPACGMGHISKVLEEHGHRVWSTDIVDYGFGELRDFLEGEAAWHGDIITNPPYKHALAFVRKALESVDDGSKVAMLLRLSFLEGKARRELYNEAPPKTIYVASGRINCCKGGDFSPEQRANNSAQAYCWIVWEKGYNGEPTLRWFN